MFVCGPIGLYAAVLNCAVCIVVQVLNCAVCIVVRDDRLFV